MYVNTSAVDRLAVKLASDEKNQPTQYVGHFFGYVPILNPVQRNRNSTKVGSIETLFTPDVHSNMIHNAAIISQMATQRSSRPCNPSR